jgi:CHAT domain-containing protein/Tfp pilus assembly protein PilF
MRLSPRPRTPSRRFVLLAAGSVAMIGALAQPPAVVHHAGKLLPHTPVERQLGPGEADSFTVDVDAGQFLHVEVDKKGVDVSLEIADAGGKPLVVFDAWHGAFGSLPASWVADRAGTLEIRVSKSARNTIAGLYRIEVTGLRPPTSADRTRIQAESEYVQADAGDRTGEAEKRRASIQGFERAEGLWRTLGDRTAEAHCLLRIGIIEYGLGDPRKAAGLFEEALALADSSGNLAERSADAVALANASADLGLNAKALQFYARAEALNRALGDRAGEARALYDIGIVYGDTGEYRKALDYYDRALALAKAIGDRAQEGRTLNSVAIVYWRLGENRKALDYYNQALALERATGEQSDAAWTLHNMGLVYSDIGDIAKALEDYQAALPMFRAEGHRHGEATTLNSIGMAYAGLGEYRRAIEAYLQALQLARTANYRDIKADALGNLAAAYSDLGENMRAINFSKQALSLALATGDRANQAAILNNIGKAYGTHGSNRQALIYYNRALALEGDIGERLGQGQSLNNIGETYSALGRARQALSYYRQALVTERSVGDRADEGLTLNNMGEAFMRLGRKKDALQCYLSALELSREVQDTWQGMILSNVMDYWQRDRNPALAVFFGKQAVNQYQSVRRNIRGLDRDLQRSYLATVSRNYRRLADLLMAQGRLAEAEQVLSLLKEQEYFDYVRRDDSEASSVDGRANLNREEAGAERRYREIEGKLVAMGAERADLLGKKSLTPEETARLEQIEKDIAAGNLVFERFLDDLARQFAAKPALSLRVQDLRETRGIMEDLRELPPSTVAIYTLVGEHKYRAILRTSDVEKAYEYPIGAAELTRKIIEFRQALQNPALDPRPLGRELYRILLGGMQKDLREARAQTLMWSLDGVLRYVPLAALYDGHHYLIEEYRTSVMTLASATRLKDRPDRVWTAAGFGVTKSYDGAPALPAVPAELAGIIAAKPGDRGVLQGDIEVDGAFTREAMRRELLKRRPVVHIASHFRFQPGNDAESFLLLGDGGHLSLAELKISANLFGGVQLLTLSACNTGVGDGSEVEGFGALAQREGAKAVVATLWPVADESTSLLMQRFYRLREASPDATKLEALRQAQLSLLRGAIAAGPIPARTRAFVTSSASIPGGIPRFREDPRAPYAHPYYWAPFFLMGNWL